MPSVENEIATILFYEQHYNNVVLSNDTIERIYTFYKSALLDIEENENDDDIKFAKKQDAYFDILFIIENQIKILVDKKRTNL